MKVCDNYYSVPNTTHRSRYLDLLLKEVLEEELNAVLVIFTIILLLFVNYVNACAVVEEFH